jgi:hypothetical protein
MMLRSVHWIYDLLSTTSPTMSCATTIKDSQGITEGQQQSLRQRLLHLSVTASMTTIGTLLHATLSC